MSVTPLPGKETVWKREVSPRDETDHFVYIIGCLADGMDLVGPVKIGVSNAPRGRLRSLQTGSPAHLVLVGSYCFWRRRHAMEVERVFHQTAKAYRTAGEWFDINPDSAVALMASNIESFVKYRLQPDGTDDYYWALSHIGLPGFDYDLSEEDFRHGQ